MRRVIIDTDPGIDDTAAIFFSLASGAMNVELMTTVYGNTDVENATRNALRILEAAGRADIPVVKGAGRPLTRPPTLAGVVHGTDGLGDFDLPEPRATPAPGRAAERMVEHIMANPGEIDLLALGPLTNVAAALTIEPAMATAVKSIIVMGGAVRTRGNVTPVASANLANDPESADIVYACGAPIVQIGLDVCRPTLITHAQLDRIRASGNTLCRFLAAVEPQITAYYRAGEREMAGSHFNDVPAAAALVEPGLFRFERWPVRIETAGKLTYGQTVVDWRRQWGMAPNTEIALEVDAPALAELFTRTLLAA
jgi:inosine-uridine nucleoside N-ribohydrolase